MQYIYSVGNLDRIDSPICIAHVTFHNFMYTRPTEPFKRLSLFMLFASLYQMKRTTRDIDYIIGLCKQIFLEG